MLRQLAQKLSKRDALNGTRWIVEVENQIDLTLRSINVKMLKSIGKH